MSAPASSPDSNNNLFEVKKVIGRKETGGKVLYRVVWRGYSRSDATWEPYENFVGDGALNCVKTFLEKREAKKKAKEVADSSFIVDSDSKVEELKRWKMKKQKLNAKKRHPSLNQPCQIKSSDDSGNDSAAPEVWLSEDDFESAPPKRARFLDTILHEESSIECSTMTRPGGVQKRKKTDHNGRKKTQHAKNANSKTKNQHVEPSQTSIDVLDHRKRTSKNVSHKPFESVGFSPPSNVRIRGKSESRRSYVDTVKGTRFVPFNSQFVNFNQVPSRSQR